MSQTPDKATSTNWALPLLFFFAIALLMVGPQLCPATAISTVSYDYEDAANFLWDFWWTRLALTQPANPYWCDWVFYPDGTSLAFHAYPLPYCLLSLPVQWLVPGLTGLLLAYHLIILLSFVLSGYGAYRLALFISDSKQGALIAGLIYAFMPYHVLNMCRLHAVAIEFFPFYIYSLLQFAERPTLRRAAFPGVWLALTYYTSLEYALYLTLFSLFWLIYQMLAARGRVTTGVIARLAFSALVFFVITSPLVSQQVRTYSAERGAIERSADEAREWSPALISLVTPSRVHPLYGRWMSFAGEYRDGRTTGMRSETTIGLLTLGLALLGLLYGRVRPQPNLGSIKQGDEPSEIRREGGLALPSRSFWAIAAVSFFTLALGPYMRLTGTWETEIPMPWLGLYHLFPPFRGGREPARFLPLAMLMAATLAALGTKAIMQQIAETGNRRKVTALLGLLILFQYLVDPAAAKLRPQIHPFYESLASESDDIAILDFTTITNEMVAQTAHGKRSAGWSGLVARSAMTNRMTPLAQLRTEFETPRRLLQLDPQNRNAALQYYRSELQRANVRYMVFPSGDQAAMYLAEILGARVRIQDDLVVCEFRMGAVPSKPQ